MRSTALSEPSYVDVGLSGTCQLHRKNLDAYWGKGEPCCYSFLYQVALSSYCSFGMQKQISCWVTTDIHYGLRMGSNSRSDRRERQIR